MKKEEKEIFEGIKRKYRLHITDEYQERAIRSAIQMTSFMIEKKTKEQILKEIEKIRGDVYQDGCGEDEWLTFDKEKDGNYVRVEELKKTLKELS